MLANPTVKAVSIPTGASTPSDEIDLGSEVLCGMVLPAAFTGTKIYFQVGVDGTFYNMYESDGTRTEVVFTANAYVPIFTDSFMGARTLKILSDGNEASARAVKLLTRVKSG